MGETLQPGLDLEIKIKGQGYHIVPAGSTAAQLIEKIQPSLPYLVAAIIVDYELEDLNYVFEKPAKWSCWI